MPLSPETRLQAACVKLYYMLWPRHAGRLFLNHNNPRGPRHGQLLKSMGLVAGVADMTLLGDNGAVFIEFKTTKGTQNQNQKSWQKTCEAAGYRYYLVKSVSQFQEIVSQNLRA
jgi:hypothetical protein